MSLPQESAAASPQIHEKLVDHASKETYGNVSFERVFLGFILFHLFAEHCSAEDASENAQHWLAHSHKMHIAGIDACPV